MEKFKKIIDQLRNIVRIQWSNDLLVCIDFLNEQYKQMDNSEKAKFITWILENYSLFDAECYLFLNDEKIEVENELFDNTTPYIFIETLKYFLAKERFDFRWAGQWVGKLKQKIECDINEGKNKEIQLIKQEASLFPTGQKIEFYKSKHAEYLQKLKSTIGFENPERIKHYWTNNPFNPLDENQSLRSMVVSQKNFNKNWGYFWLPMPNGHVFERENEMHTTIDNIMDYAFQPALELHLVMQWINNQLEPQQNDNSIETTEDIPLIDIEEIRDYYNEYCKVMPKEFKTESKKEFEKRFYKYFECNDKPLVPKGKGGRYPDIYKNAREWQDNMINEIYPEVKRNFKEINYAKWVLASFGHHVRMKKNDTFLITIRN
jgi:hypothetical protein